jgi:tetratricopeptide (TPR) repeat protein
MRLFLLAIALSATLATSAQNAQEWRDSLAALNKAIALQPRSTDLRLRKAAVNIELNQWDYAIDEYGRVLQLDADNLAARYFRAYAHNHQRHYDLALRDYEAFLAQVPSHFEARMGLAMVKRKLGRQVDTVDELNRLVQQHPDSAVAYAVRADYERELKQYEPALYDWDEAIRRRPDNADFVVSKADILIRIYKWREAREVLDAAVRRGIPRGALKEWYDKIK